MPAAEVGAPRRPAAVVSKTTLGLGELPTLPRVRVDEGGTLALGQTLAGRYELVGILGKGVSGTSYLAWAERGYVAVKVIPTAQGDSWGPSGPSDFGAWWAEKEGMRRVQHPNVVRFVDAFVVEGHRCIVTEWAQGMTLDSALTQRRVLSKYSQCLRLGAEVAEGLAAIHDAGGTHLDITPSNIVVQRRDGALGAVILDFGTCQFARTPARKPMANGAYLAPEGWLEDMPLTPATDLYALGGVLFEMFMGHAPFCPPGAIVARGPLEQRHHFETPPPVPGVVGPIVARLLEKSPSKRYPSARAVSAALQEAITEHERRPLQRGVLFTLARWLRGLP